MTMPDTSSYFSRTAVEDEDRPKSPWVKFADIGDEVTLTVTDKGMTPDYEYNKNPDAPKVQKTWPDGQLKEFLRVTGTLDAPTRVGDGTTAGRIAEVGEEVNLAIKGKQMTGAVGGGVREAGANDINPGGKLWVKFTGWVPAKKGDAKDYAAKYKPGAAPSPSTTGFLANSGGPTPEPTPRDDAPPF